MRELLSTPSPNYHATNPKLDENDNYLPCFVCLLTFLPGKTIKDYKEDGHAVSQQIFYRIGNFVANIVITLKVCNRVWM